MQNPIRVAFAWTAVVLSLAACTKKEAPKDTTAAMAPAPAAPAPAVVVAIALPDVAGKWNVSARPESGPDTSVTTLAMTATADTTGWTSTLPSGKTVKNHVSVSGDSIMLKSDPYPSIRRKGKTVWTETVYHKQGDKLVGTTTAHYANSGADSVLTLHSEATKQ